MINYFVGLLVGIYKVKFYYNLKDFRGREKEKGLDFWGMNWWVIWGNKVFLEYSIRVMFKSIVSNR